jgi:hypothetical protein
MSFTLNVLRILLRSSKGLNSFLYKGSICLESQFVSQGSSFVTLCLLTLLLGPLSLLAEGSACDSVLQQTRSSDQANNFENHLTQFFAANRQFWQWTLQAFTPVWQPIELRIDSHALSVHHEPQDSTSDANAPLNQFSDVSLFQELGKKNVISIQLAELEELIEELSLDPYSKSLFLLFLVSHEYAHHVQSGLRPPQIIEPFSFWSRWFMSREMTSQPQFTPCNGIRCYELQADCLAAQFIKRFSEQHGSYFKNPFEAVSALIFRLGGDQDHGSGEQRRASFELGFKNSDPLVCLESKNLWPILEKSEFKENQ